MINLITTLLGSVIGSMIGMLLVTWMYLKADANHD
jgi:hypothetical protein